MRFKLKKNKVVKKFFLSPLFQVKKKKKFLNIHNFNKLIVDKKLSYIALGGINETNYKKIKLN